MRSRIIAFFLLLLACAPIRSIAQTITIDQILTSALNDDRVVRQRESERYLNSLNYKLPSVKKVELRLGFNGNNTPDSLDGNLRNEDYYSLNVVPNRRKEIRLQKEIQPAQLKMYNSEVEVFKMQALEDRFVLVSNMYYSMEILKKRKELLELLNTKNNLLQQMLNDGVSIKVNDALDVDKDLMQLYGLLLDEESSITLYTSKLSQFLNTSENFTLDFSDIIPIDRLVSNFLLLKVDATITNPNLVYKEAQYQYAKANFNLERVQNTNIINAIQLGYNRPAYPDQILKKFNPDNTLTFRLGISVPIAGNNNLSKNNANMQQYNAMLNWKSAQSIQGKNTEIQQAKLESLIKQYKALEAIYTKSIVNKFLENEKLMAQSNALEITDLKIAKKKLEISLLNSANNVMQSYITLLAAKGFLNYDLRHQYLLAK